MQPSDFFNCMPDLQVELKSANSHKQLHLHSKVFESVHYFQAHKRFHPNQSKRQKVNETTTIVITVPDIITSMAAFEQVLKSVYKLHDSQLNIESMLTTVDETVHYICAADYLSIQNLVDVGRRHLKTLISMETVKDISHWCAYQLPCLAGLSKTFIHFLAQQNTSDLKTLISKKVLDQDMCVKVLLHRCECLEWERLFGFGSESESDSESNDSHDNQ